MKCAHAFRSDEACRLDARGGHAVEVVLCDWADALPGRLVNAPTWVLKQVIGGRAIRPEHDCVGCPAFKARA